MAKNDTPVNMVEVNREELAQILLEQVEDNLAQLGFDDEQIEYAMDPIMGEHPSVIEYYLNEGVTLITRAQEFDAQTNAEQNEEQLDEGEQIEILENEVVQNEAIVNQDLADNFAQMPQALDNNTVNNTALPTSSANNQELDVEEAEANDIMLLNDLNANESESDNVTSKRKHEDDENNNNEDRQPSKLQKTL